jgi:hypothetical protein
MLLEVVEPWPHFFGLGAVLSEALVLPTLTMLWSHIVNTHLMSLKVAQGFEAVRSRAARDFTYTLYSVASCMFPSAPVSIIACQ